jgi:hypothetical protein
LQFFESGQAHTLFFLFSKERKARPEKKEKRLLIMKGVMRSVGLSVPQKLVLGE